MRRENKAPAKSGDKVARMCPDNELKSPKKSFDETFSAETVLMQAFFPAK
jgi:hypothetical protein